MIKRVKPKLCKQCGVEFIPKYSTLQVCCSVKCAIEFNSPDEIKNRFQTLKEDAQPISFYIKSARVAFQLWVRLRDKDLPCISCGSTSTKQWDGGHYLKAELYTGLIFNEMNCNKQCSECNGTNMHGNLIGYRKGLVKKYGVEAVNVLENSADENRVFKFTKFELLQIKKHYQQKIKDIQNGKGTSIL